MPHAFRRTAALLALLAAAGCSNSPEPVPTCQVAGTVSVNGTPLDAGTIVFRPADPSAPGAAVSAPVKDGHYSLAVPKGRRTVTFSSGGLPVVDQSASSESRSHSKMTIPAQYRDGVSVDVEADNPKLDFDLRGK